MWCGGGNTCLQPYVNTTLAQLGEGEIRQSWPHFGENTVTTMQENDFDTFFGERGIVFGDSMDEVVKLPYGFDSAEPGSRHDKCQKLLAHAQIGLHIGSFQQRNDVIAQVKSITQAFHGFAMLCEAGQRG